VALLADADIPDDMAYRALNCALITWRTNRTISAKEPQVYLRERAEANTLGEEDLKRRLRSHLIQPAFLELGGYSALDSEPAKRSARIQEDYAAFLRGRAKIVLNFAEQLCDGKEPYLPDLK
jgi:hypothetical protein